MIERFNKLLSVKSIVTIALTAVFAYLSVTDRISEQFMLIYTVIVSFYFGTQNEKNNGAGEQK
jgi:hypothetical protein